MTDIKKKRRDYLLPASVLVAAVLVSGALIYNTGKNAAPKGSLTATVAGDTMADEQANPAANVAPITKEDHLRGNPSAPIAIIEFSDTECSYCKTFQETLQQLVADYGNQIAWVYRHFPLDSLHSKARKEAEATECAAELGGNDGFWNYIDRLYEVTPSNDGLDLALLPQIAEDVGLNRTAFESCLASGKYADEVEKDYQDAVNSGGRGTPYPVVVTANGDYISVPGALPYEQMKLFLDQLLESL